MNGRINPKTGKRFAWEQEQAAAKSQDLKAVKAEIALMERQQRAFEARDDLMKYVMFTDPHPENPNDIDRSAYEPATFHRQVAKVLESVVKGDIPQLIFCMPPRHGKTRLATVSLAAWYSGNFPHHDIICAMATDQLATDNGADVRNLFSRPQHKLVFPTHRLRKGGAAKDNIQTDQGGRMIFAGRGGQINGRGANLLLIDDLYKDSAEAQSPVIRDQAWDWFVKVALFRRMGKKLTVLTMTRWHSDDIIGRLTDPENPKYDPREASQWKIIRLPGIAEEDDPPESLAGRKPGEALWPERFSAEYLLGSQRRDPLGFASLVQQRPTVADGVYFRREHFKFYRKHDLPANLRIYCASDHALGLKQTNDYTVMIKVGVDEDNNMYVIDGYRARVPANTAVEAMLAMAGGKNKPLIWWAGRDHITKSIGPFLHKRMSETGTYFNIREVTPIGDKLQRAQSIIARVGVGKVYFPDDTLWATKFIDEMLSFPNANHDDVVDTMALLGLGLQSQFAASPISATREKLPATMTLAWVKQADRWAADRAARAKVGGF